MELFRKMMVFLIIHHWIALQINYNKLIQINVPIQNVTEFDINN